MILRDTHDNYQTILILTRAGCCPVSAVSDRVMILLGIRAFKFSNSRVNNSWMDIKKKKNSLENIMFSVISLSFCNEKQTGQATKSMLYDLIGNGNAVLSVNLSSSLSLKKMWPDP